MSAHPVTLFNPPLPTAHKKVAWPQLPGCAPAMALVHAAQNHQLIVAVTHDTQSALKLERECKPFAQYADIDIHVFPDWETLPYDAFSPHQDIVSDRLTTLSTLPRMQQGLIIIPITTLLHRVVPKSFLEAHSFILKVGDTLNLAQTQNALTESCYRRVGEVNEHGEFAIRGAILDLFPMGSQAPVRIDLFDETVDSIRYFDPTTQRSENKVEEIRLLPAREFPMTEDAVKLFRKQWRETFSGNPKDCDVYHDVSQHVAPAGIEYYLPLFYEGLSVFTDYLPKNALIALWGTPYEDAKQFWQTIESRYDQYGHDRLRPLLPPKSLFVPVDELFQNLNQFQQIHINPASSTANDPHFELEPIADVSINHKLNDPLNALKNFILQSDVKVILCAETKGRRESLLDLFAREDLSPKVYDSVQDCLDAPDDFCLTVASFDAGFVSKESGFILIAEAQLYGQQVMQRRRRQKAKMTESEYQIRHLAELQINDPIVHVDFGVGRYQGLIHLDVNGHAAEFLQIQYAGEDKLYVPVDALHLISKFSGVDAEHAPLHKLGTDKWSKAKEKAMKRAHDVAAELLDIYARRQAKQGFAFKVPEDQYLAFCAQFPFEETEDQSKAIEAVLADMQALRPMDRLVCGDVGFGKTEVAMRAAFLAVMNDKQVGILVPTTLLAQQHYETFKDRFADWPIRVEVLSRFKTQKEQKAIIDALEAGKIDILIGTHKLIQSDIQFKDLGLLIVDEEHRFGVKQKEKLKAYRADVDILALTATPIPRTLNMAFAQIRDLSIIATPPQKRLSVKTFVRQRQKPLIREAIMRELMRGGQIYYVHNTVSTIDKAARDILESVPEARISVAHGQMRERELERIMADFYHQRFNVLVCSTIIETGIDVPSANTIIIERADAFGLAQLHQLRGRVGRSHHQAYAYCLTPNFKTLKPDARKRLEALESLEELGSGFSLATHDLEIRGAGELLGEEQSGHMQTIGFHLYMEILEKAVKALQAGETLSTHPQDDHVEINLTLSALIPDSYVKDVNMRLVLYKRLSEAKDHSALQELQSEMIDRFGLLPDPVKNLFKITKLKRLAKPLGIKKIEASPNGGRIQFTEQPCVDTSKIIELIRTQPHTYQLKGSQILKFKEALPEPVDRFETVEQLIKALTPNASSAQT